VPDHTRTLKWTGRSAFSGYAVIVRATDSNGNVVDRFSYTKRVKAPRFELAIDAGFSYDVLVQPLISNGLVSVPCSVFQCAARPLPKTIMNQAEETAFKHLVTLAGVRFNVLVVGHVGVGKSELINRIYKAVTGTDISIAPSSNDSLVSLTLHLMRYVIAQQLNLIDSRGFLLQGNNVAQDFGAYMATLPNILDGQVAVHERIGGVLTAGQVNPAMNRIHGVIVVENMSLDYATVTDAERNQLQLLTFVRQRGLPYVVMATHADKCTKGRLPNVNLATTPEDCLRMSELASTVQREDTFPVAKFVGALNGAENAQHRRLVLTALRSLFDAIIVANPPPPPPGGA
jgi:GTP-binding protein EngB required for normal cell division